MKGFNKTEKVVKEIKDEQKADEQEVPVAENESPIPDGGYDLSPAAPAVVEEQKTSVKQQETDALYDRLEESVISDSAFDDIAPAVIGNKITNVSKNPRMVGGVKLEVGESYCLTDEDKDDDLFMKKLDRAVELKVLERGTD